MTKLEGLFEAIDRVTEAAKAQVEREPALAEVDLKIVVEVEPRKDGPGTVRGSVRFGLN